MCKQKHIKRPPAPAVEQLLGRIAKPPLVLSLLLFLVLVCPCSSSASSQRLNYKSLDVEDAHDVSSPVAAAALTAVGDALDGKGAFQQVLKKGLRPVSKEWISGALNRFGWHAPGSAAAVVLVVVLVIASIFAAASRRPKAGEASWAGGEEPTPEPSGGEQKHEEEDQDKGEGQIDEQIASGELEILPTLQHSVHLVALLAATVNKKGYSALLDAMKKHTDTAAKYQSAAEIGEPGALAALAAHNQKATQLIMELLEDAMYVVTESARRLNSCKDAAVIADASLARRVFNKSGIASSYQEAWDQAVAVCDSSIRFLRTFAQRVHQRLPNLPSLQQKQLVLLPNRISAAGVAVLATDCCVWGQDAATKAAKQLKLICLNLAKSNRRVEVELEAANLEVQRRIAAAMLEAAHSSVEDKTKRLPPEEANLLAKWDERHKVAQDALSSMQEQLQLLKDMVDPLDFMYSATGATSASKGAAHLRDLLNGLSELLSRPTFLGAKQHGKKAARMEDVVSVVEHVMDLRTAMKPIVEAAAATEQEVLDVGSQVEMQLSGLKDLPWVPQLLLEKVEKQLGNAIVNAKVKREAVQQRVIEMSRSALSGIVTSLDELAADTSALKENCKTLWQLRAEVEMLVLLKGMVEFSEKAKEASLGMIADSEILHASHHRRAGELKMQVELSVKAARRADSLSGVVEAVSEYVSASEKLLHLSLMPLLELKLENDLPAAAEV
ncbi:hypothetical protein EMWEY_00039800 [Eimeria maxima]|uniref:Transmembrane protein n=1 Tax=Eimeria maxima TaxID=5804 RepID=U6MI28_EIMMA|nr:hypothetical protein EMWEY_00039800 [Eimeria maxima]CDJ61310.1 hypothetical protein EMWEY_00039800 [Eimeria maxima]